MMYEMNCIRTMKRSFLSTKVLSMVEKKKTLMLIGALALCIIMLSFSIISTKVTAEKVISSEKLVTSVKIEKGDSLWNIASEYITDEYADMNIYINEIKKSNGLTSDIIHEGSYIIVPYYTSY